jgi:chromosome segregation ATPase
MPPDDVPVPLSAKSDQTPLFGGVVLAAILTLAIVGQTTGLLSVLRHSSQLEAKQVRSDTLDSEIKKLTKSITSANNEAALAAKDSETSRGRMQQLKTDEELLRGKVIPMQESVRKSEQELNALRSETAKLSGQRDALTQGTKELEARRQSAASELSQIEGQKAALSKAATEASGQLALLEREISQAQRKRDDLAVLTARTEELERQRGALTTEGQNLKKQVEDARNALGEAQARLVTATRDQSEALKSATTERAELASFRAQRDALAEENRRLSAERTSAGATLDSLQSKLATAKADQSDANRLLAETKRALDSSTSELAATQAQKRILLPELETLRAETKRLESERGKASAAVESTRDSLAAMEAKLAKAQATVSQEGPSTEALAKLRDAIRIQVENLNQELRALNEAARQIKTSRETIQPQSPKPITP